MKKIKYIIFLILLFIFITPTAYAYTNMSTKYNVTMFDYETYMKNQTCGSTSMYDYVNDFISSINWSNSTYQTFITATFISGTHALSSLNMYFIQTDYVNQSQGNKIWVKGTYTSGSSYPYQFGYTASKSTNPVGYMSLKFDGNCSESDLPQFTNYLTSLVNNGTYNINFNPNTHVMINNAGSSYYNSSYSLTSLNNNSSYDINGSWWYYSSYDLYMANTSEAQGNNNYWKTIHLTDNNTDYGLEAKLPSYYDLYPPQVQPTFIGYKTSLDTFYTNLDPSDFNSYNLKFNFRVPQSVLGFYQTPQEYVDNTSFDFVCGGRIPYDNGNYYLYESFACSLSESYTLTSNSIEYNFNNISTNQSLSNYDKLYVTLKTRYLDSDISTTLFGFNYIYNLGSFYNTSYKGAIYEDLSSLPLNFNLYISSNNPQAQSKLYVDTSNFDSTIYTIGFSNTNQSEYFAVGQSVLADPSNYEELINFKVASVTNDRDIGIMIFQQNGSSSLNKLNLFFNGGIYLSYDIGNNTFYYVDSSGTVTTGNFNEPLISNSTDSYDISYYISRVTSFIDDLSADSVELSLITQSLYNGLPLFIQTFIFVLFILSCVYFTYLLIRK